MNQELIEFCELYNLPLEHLGATLKDPKVIPMIRGKAFEFSVKDRLSRILNQNIWNVSKPFVNPQLGSHDQDVLIKHIATNTEITIECKLSAKGQYKYSTNESIFKIKCMRSRTLGPELVRRLAPLRGMSEISLSVHNDQYLVGDFDLVITSLANAFYSTNKEGIFIWNPSNQGQHFLEQKYGAGLNAKQYQDLAFNDMYVAKASNLIISRDNEVVCTRKKCIDNENCGFIPNYPLLKFNHQDLTGPSNRWVHISNIENLLLDFIKN
ncbi:hypothetical protein [Acinetobacter baumannii]|uniref:hypothetical protein n=1 Tax=Acinetobacter baumannii TaxID=470 RepID=UPI002342899F|nr:hypothetical protein [Acinetobacter baumannii]